MMLPFLIVLLIFVLLIALGLRLHMVLYARGVFLNPNKPAPVFQEQSSGESNVDLGIPDRTPPQLVAPFLAISGILALFLVGMLLFSWLFF